MKKALRNIYSYLLANFVYKINYKKNITLSGLSFVKRQSLVAGKDCFINRGCYIGCETILGDFVMLAASVAVIGGDHEMKNIHKPMIHSGREKIDCQVIIESDVWIGHGAIIIGPVRIGQGSIVAAGSVVVKDVPQYVVVAGVPAKIIKNRFNEQHLIDEHKKMILKNSSQNNK